MKKALSFIVCLVLIITLCGCRAGVGELLSDFGNAIGEIAEKAGVLNESGIFVTKKIGKDEVKELKPADVEPEGVNAIYYNSLDSKRKKIYLYMRAAAEEMPDGWFYCGKAVSGFANDIAIAYKAMLCDNPQIFWMPASYLIAKNSGKACVAFNIDYEGQQNEYLMTRRERDTARPVLEESVVQIISVAAAKPGDYEKELYVHDYICSGARYDPEGGKMIFSSWGALVERVCVCEGFSRAMQLVMQRLGIPCALVYGEYENEGHMWNCVNLDGDWYHLDLTWNRSDEHGALHEFFNVTDEQITEDHVISPLYTAGEDYSDGQNFNILIYECTATAYNYFEYGGRFLTDDTARNAELIYADSLRGAPFAELRDLSSIPVEQTLSLTADFLYGRLRLVSYLARKNEVLVFFENTY